jgi:hypothetical protein
MSTPEALHKNMNALRNPSVVHPFPQGGGDGVEIQIGPMRKDPADLGVDLHITQLLGEGAVGTTWPRIHPHGHPPLTEQLNSTAEKGPQKVCTH